MQSNRLYRSTTVADRACSVWSHGHAHHQCARRVVDIPENAFELHLIRAGRDGPLQLLCLAQDHRAQCAAPATNWRAQGREWSRAAVEGSVQASGCRVSPQRAFCKQCIMAMHDTAAGPPRHRLCPLAVSPVNASFGTWLDRLKLADRPAVLQLPDGASCLVFEQLRTYFESRTALSCSKALPLFLVGPHGPHSLADRPGCCARGSCKGQSMPCC